MAAMTSNRLIVLDTETTGLDSRIHWAYEVAWTQLQLDGSPGAIRVCRTHHDLEFADSAALSIGRYYERGFTPKPSPSELEISLLAELHGATIIGANPAFDASFLRRTLGYAPWHYRLIDVEVMAMQEFGWDRPAGFGQVVERMTALGIDLPVPDHTAVGDVEATCAVYSALTKLSRLRNG